MITFFFGAAALSAVAAWTDLRTGHIPNKLTLLALLTAVAGHFARGYVAGGIGGGLEQGVLSLAGAALCALVPLFMFWKGGIGGGDVKLFAALGALLHPLAGLEAETYAFVAAALVAPAKLAWEGKLTRTLLNTAALIANPLRKKDQRKDVPVEMRAWFRLGPAVFVGTAACFLVHAFAMGAGR